MGYEFQISEIQHPAELKAKQAVPLLLTGKNLGVAPFYYNWSVEWALLDSSDKVQEIHKTTWDIRNWQPGPFSEKTKIAFDVPPGTYRLAPGNS